MNKFSQQLQGIHHVGITVEDMGKTLEFYTEILGGKIIISEIGLDGDIMHNTLLQKEEIETVEKGLELRSLGIPNLRDGKEKLDVYFIQFENVVLELLQYRDANYEAAKSLTFPAKHPFSSPAFVNSMHISFYLKDDVDVDQFVHDLETECHRRGMNQVQCNRVVRVNSKAEAQKVAAEHNSCKLFDPHFGDFEGWTLVYCKGPNGEQLEFNQVLRKAKVLFATAQADYHKSQAIN